MITKYLKPLVLALTLLACSTSFAGSIYKWKDANGVIHYGERAPSGIETETIGALTSSRAEDKPSIDDTDFDFDIEDDFAAIPETEFDQEIDIETSNTVNTSDNPQLLEIQQQSTPKPGQDTPITDPNVELQKAQQLAEVEALRQRNCAAAQADIAKLAGKSRVRVRNTDGSYKLLGDKELNDKRTAAQSYLNDRCK